MLHFHSVPADTSKECRKRETWISETGGFRIYSHPKTGLWRAKSSPANTPIFALRSASGGIPRANQTNGCLLSRGGPVSPRRNRNLG